MCCLRCAGPGDVSSTIRSGRVRFFCSHCTLTRRPGGSLRSTGTAVVAMAVVATCVNSTNKTDCNPSLILEYNGMSSSSALRAIQ